MMRSLASVLLLLASCSGGAAVGSQDDACMRQADNDPEVVEMVRKGTGNLDYAWQNSDNLAALKRQATLRCLRARGLAPKGGVEQRRVQ